MTIPGGFKLAASATAAERPEEEGRGAEWDDEKDAGIDGAAEALSARTGEESDEEMAERAAGGREEEGSR